jgi:hypothetical protein
MSNWQAVSYQPPHSSAHERGECNLLYCKILLEERNGGSIRHDFKPDRLAFIAYWIALRYRRFKTSFTEALDDVCAATVLNAFVRTREECALEYINLSYTHMEEKSIAALAQLCSLPFLETLKLKANIDLGVHPALKGFFYALQTTTTNNSVLKNLLLVSTELSRENTLALGACIEHSKSLEQLVLKKTKFRDYDARNTLLKAITASSVLKKLELEFSNFSTDGVRIGTLVRLNTCLESLIIHNNRREISIRSEIEDIFEALAHTNRTLTVFDLSAELSRDYGYFALAEMLRENSTLKEFYFRGIHISSAEMYPILFALANSNKTLAKFYISTEFLDPTAIDILHALVVGNNPTLTHLFVHSENRYATNAILLRWAKTFSVNTTLLQFHAYFMDQDLQATNVIKWCLDRNARNLAHRSSTLQSLCCGVIKRCRLATPSVLSLIPSSLHPAIATTTKNGVFQKRVRPSYLETTTTTILHNKRKCT